jgi:putative peptide maturation dehydrogenase
METSTSPVSAHSSARIRRCAVLVVEPRESLELDPRGLLGGGSAIVSTVSMLALAPHLDAAVALDAEEIVALAKIGETIWQTRDAISKTVPDAVIGRLLAKGILIGEGAEHAAWRERDARVRETCWSPLAAVAHAFGRWSDASVDDDVRITPHRTLADLVREYGLPPPHLTSRGEPGARVALPQTDPTPIDAVISARVTCRNFDTSRALSLDDFSRVLKRVVGCSAEVEVLPGVKALKKSHPSGGALHPLEPYLLVQRVDGVAPGLYHYHAGTHALEPIATIEADTLRSLALRAVAGQAFFAEAHVQLILAARFRRTFWKYRNHPKAYRAIVLEAGHVSQNLYLAAAELGLGAFVTAAINEIDIERAFGLDPIDEGPLAVCGFGMRAKAKATAEFDPLEAVWIGDSLRD